MFFMSILLFLSGKLWYAAEVTKYEVSFQIFFFQMWLHKRDTIDFFSHAIFHMQLPERRGPNLRPLSTELPNCSKRAKIKRI